MTIYSTLKRSCCIFITFPSVRLVLYNPYAAVAWKAHNGSPVLSRAPDVPSRFVFALDALHMTTWQMHVRSELTEIWLKGNKRLPDICGRAVLAATSKWLRPDLNVKMWLLLCLRSCSPALPEQTLLEFLYCWNICRYLSASSRFITLIGKNTG